MIFFDTETTGYHGPTVLIQWARDDGEINLHSVWTSPVGETLELIEEIAQEDVCGFNLSFDWFHLCQTYTTLNLMHRDLYPIDHIDKYASLEPRARDGPCLKPQRACDLMLHARKGPYQSTMDRHDIRVRRVPTALAWPLANELEKRIVLKDIYFARKKDQSAKRWEVDDIEDEDGEIDPDFKDIVLKFRSSSALKVLAMDALQLDSAIFYDDVEVEQKPVEYGYAPFALAVGRPGKWNGAWPEVIRFHIRHWAYYELARKYARDDVDYTRRLYKFFGSPEPGDDDSELACMVGACRWRGYAVNVDGVKEIIQQRTAQLKHGNLVIPTSAAVARKYVTEKMSPTEILICKNSTKKVILEEIAKWTLEDESPHPAAERAALVMQARQAQYEIDLLGKFVAAGRFHADFNVIGALSSRMSGGSGLNAQGIKKTEEIRSQFPLAVPPFVLAGGDFSGFEVTLAEAYYNDPKLREALMSGKSLHGIFGTFVYPGKTYEDILASKGKQFDMYTRAKSAVFAMLYGGTEHTLKERLGVELEAATDAMHRFARAFPGVGQRRQEIFSKFASMRQPGGIGSAVEWHEPADFVESMFGFRRYFTLENMICKTLYDLAQSPPKEWRSIKIKVQRRERMQTAAGAVQSALFGAAFAIQAANMRAAGNHVIQSSGAQVTKRLQRRIWDLQPSGVEKWLLQPMNIHDEVMVPVLPELTQKLKETVDGVVQEYKQRVPLLEMEWVTGLKSWADK
jgi:hypothetical protein